MGRIGGSRMSGHMEIRLDALFFFADVAGGTIAGGILVGGTIAGGKVAGPEA